MHSASRAAIDLSALRYAWGFLLLSAIAICGVVSAASPAGAQALPATNSAPPDQETFQLRVESNLVAVRVIVRDSRGRAVGDLGKQDFRVFDNDKEQNISQFAIESHAPPESASSASQFQGANGPAGSVADRFLALYFDDLDMSFEEIVHAREAADRFLTANLTPSDRAAIFTSTGLAVQDFTSDLNKLRAALLQIKPNSHIGSGCPEISDYQAKMIVEYAPPQLTQGGSAIPSAGTGFRIRSGRGSTTSPSMSTPGSDAMNVALSDALYTCNMPGVTGQFIFMKAQQVLAQAIWQAQYSLEGLEDVVHHISEMPGQRNVAFISPGFLTSELGAKLDAITDHALRSQVIVSSIDSRGLGVSEQEADIRTSYTNVDANILAAKRDLALQREQAALSVMSEMAEGTGGTFFHNDNDLTVGLRRAAVHSEISYILAFQPSDLKRDGRFHALKVTLREKRRGMTLQARRGYFAPLAGAKPEEESAEAIRAAVLSTGDIRDLPLDISTEVSPSAEKRTGKAQLALMTRLDPAAVHFRKDGGRNRDSLTFVSCVFDHDGLWMAGERKKVDLDLPDEKLRDLIASPGLMMRSVFELAPGNYTIREVVMDSADHHLGALTRTVSVPELQGKGS